MHTYIKSCNWLILFVLFVSCKQGGTKQIPLDNFFMEAVKTSYLISPDGKYISYLQPYKNRLNIFIQTADGKNVTRITDETARSISYYFWANNNELLYLEDRTGNDRIHLHAVNKDGSNTRELLTEENTRLRFINPVRVWNNELLLALNKRDSTVFDAYRLNINTKKLTLAVQNPGNISSWYTDQQGKLRMAVANDGINETLLFRDNESNPFRAVVTNNFKTSIVPIGFCMDDVSCIYALSNQNRDKTALVEFNCKTGTEHREIFSRNDVDVISGEYSIPKKKMIYATYETWKKENHYLDDAIREIYNDIENQLPQSEIQLVDQDSASQKFIIRTFTDKTPGAFYLYGAADKSLVNLSEINSSLEESEMCEMKPVTYKNRDGVTIHGYLTLPKGASAANLPVVVIPHGGPSSRNSWGFNAEVQFLANRGYAVFQTNFRGSTGYGKKFWISGFRNWGSGMQNDITDGVKWLIGEGIANPKRIAIYGSSFGGYSALFGLCFHPELYACGASYSGLINLFTYIKGSPLYVKPYLPMYYEMVGDPEKEADYFRAVSPVFHTDKIQDPVLIAQGGKDPRVNVNETSQFVRELKKRQIPVTYILKENERHFFRDPDNRHEFYRKLEKFLADNIGRK